ncbi:class F sortase [Candidatus Nomurabacteria bacterium]|nr:class F sortase [Candidatus Nomurabacteria bacterium]
MKKKSIHFKKRIILTSVLLIFFVLIIYLFFYGQKVESKKINSKNNTSINITENKTSSIPINIKIPKINVNTNIESVGILSDGAMGVPNSPENTAWFNLGVIPGDIGSAVIDGHSGWKDNIPAIFDDLYKLKKGDKIYITNDKGIVNTFVVTKTKIYKSNEDTTSVFIPNDKISHLNLITCTGIWNSVEKSHTDRLVIFSDKEIL